MRGPRTCSVDGVAQIVLTIPRKKTGCSDRMREPNVGSCAFASFRCRAPIRSLSEVKRTWADPLPARPWSFVTHHHISPALQNLVAIGA